MGKEKKKNKSKKRRGSWQLLSAFRYHGRLKTRQRAQGGQRGREREGSVWEENSVCISQWISSVEKFGLLFEWRNSSGSCTQRSAHWETSFVCSTENSSLASSECDIFGCFFFNRRCRIGCGGGKVYVHYTCCVFLLVIWFRKIQTDNKVINKTKKKVFLCNIRGIRIKKKNPNITPKKLHTFSYL